MYLRTHPLRVLALRHLSLGCAGILALTAVSLTGAPASAAPWSGTQGRAVTFGYNGGGCSSSTPGTSVPATGFASNAPATLDIAGSATGTGPTVPDTATMSSSVTGTAQVTEGTGGVTDINVDAHLKASAHRNLGAGSACGASASAAVSVSGTFSTAAPGVLDLDFDNTGSGFTVHTVALVRTAPAPTSGAVTTTFSELGHTHRLLVVPAGDWSLTVSLNALASDTNTPSDPGPSADVTVHMDGAFRPSGVAVGGTAGSASKYLTMSDSQSCAAHSVIVDFTKKAGKKPKKGQKPVIRKATFFVDDVKVKSVKKPNKNTLVTLTGLPVQDDVRVSAELKLAHKVTLLAARTYYPCP